MLVRYWLSITEVNAPFDEITAIRVDYDYVEGCAYCPLFDLNVAGPRAMVAITPLVYARARSKFGPCRRGAMTQGQHAESRKVANIFSAADYERLAEQYRKNRKVLDIPLID